MKLVRENGRRRSPRTDYRDSIRHRQYRVLRSEKLERRHLLAGAGDVTGSVFNDLNGDGEQNGSETGRDGQSVYIDRNLNGKFDTGEPQAVTDVDGDFSIDVPDDFDPGQRVSVRVDVQGAAVTGPRLRPSLDTVDPPFARTVRMLVDDQLDPTDQQATNVQGIEAADFNGDGVTDVAFYQGVGFNKLGISIADPVSGALPSDSTNNRFHSIDVVDSGARLAEGDIDGDGTSELAVLEPFQDVVRVFGFEGSSGEPVLLKSLTIANPVAAIFADVDPDTEGNELLVLTGNPAGLTVYKSTDLSAPFDSSATVPAAGTLQLPVAFTTGHFNDDDRLDLAISDSPSNRVVILNGTGGGGFQFLDSFTMASPPEDLAAGLLKGADSMHDLAVINANQVSVYQGDGQGGFTEVQNLTRLDFESLPTKPSRVVAGDMDGDGDSELAFTSIGKPFIQDGEAKGRFSIFVLYENNDGDLQPRFDAEFGVFLPYGHPIPISLGGKADHSVHGVAIAAHYQQTEAPNFEFPEAIQIFTTGQHYEDTLEADPINVGSFGVDPLALPPGIQIQTQTNGIDADVSPGPMIAAGDSASISFIVSNTGNTPLGSVLVIDDHGTPLDASDDFSPAFMGGDDDSDGLLDVEETWTYEASRMVLPGQFTNHAIVTANPVDFDGNDLGSVADVNDSDPSNHFGLFLDVDIETLVNGEDADGPSGPQLVVGENATFLYQVTSNSNVGINVTVSDDNGTSGDPSDDFAPSFNGGDEDIDGLLDAGEIWTYQATRLVTGGQFTNIATVEATHPGTGTAGTDSDPSHYFGVLPPPSLSIEANNAVRDEGDMGQTSFTFTVNRFGNISGITTVNFGVDGTGDAPADAADFGGLEFPSGRLTFAANESSKSITAIVPGDTHVEADETFRVMLSNASGNATIASAVAEGKIVNDDQLVGDVRVLVPPNIADLFTLPADGQRTAILFVALTDTMLTVKDESLVSSLHPPAELLGQGRQAVPSTIHDGELRAPLMAGQIYALVFPADDVSQVRSIESSAGGESLSNQVGTNILTPTDVNGDGQTSSLDALQVINQVGQQALAEGETTGGFMAGQFFDVSGNGDVTAGDALRIINEIARSQSPAESDLVEPQVLSTSNRRVASTDTRTSHEVFDRPAKARRALPLMDQPASRVQQAAVILPLYHRVAERKNVDAALADDHFVDALTVLSLGRRTDAQLAIH